MSRTPSVHWAQRKDRVYLTVDIADAADTKVGIDPSGKLALSATGGPRDDRGRYELHLELCGPVSKEESKVAVNPRYVFLMLMKPEVGPHWPRLLKGGGKPPPHVKVDWGKFKDEDEEEEEEKRENFDLGELDDMSKFDEFHDEELDSDDEDLPELEAEQG